MRSHADPLFVPLGDSEARLFGMSARERAMRIAANMGLDTADEAEPERPLLAAAMDHAWDPAWLKSMRTRPNTILTYRGRPVLAHLAADARQGDALSDVIAGKIPAGYEVLDAETAEVSYAELRKRERPFVLPLDPANPEPVERALYDAAYKGVTDILTLYLWRRPAFHLTRWAAQTGITPNAVTAVGAIGVVLAFYFFWIGDYWLGTAAGFVFMVLDTVDGKLARCTGASSKWGNVFDHGIDLIHPPFWYWAWAHGLAAYGTPMEPVMTMMVLWAIVGGYVLQRLIEGIFMRRYEGMHIHVWKPIDSRFRLITARRNPNMVLLVAALLAQRPDIGLELVALWTMFSLIFHAVRLAQAREREARGVPITSWLA
ncbi:MAG: CDP-alcohol phosphatidyltransferase family protein [Sphingomicrobium sp.]